MNVQAELIPDAVPEFVWGDVPIDFINTPEVGPKPTKALIDSIARFGIVSPPVVVKVIDGTYDLVDGRRRVQAAIELGFDAIRCKVYDETFAYAPGMTLDLNVIRSSNPIAELDAIEELISLGATEAEIAKATGLAKSTITKRLRLSQLNQTLRDGASEGKIAISVVERVAKLGDQAQERLAEKFEDQGKLTGPMVDEEVQVRTDQAVADVPLSVFQVEKEPWNLQVAERIETTIPMIPIDMQYYRDRLATLVKELRSHGEG